ncbi:hypothetical protein VNI00_008107 [Paramarasmius palmivorus]|uniref:F-box domain-containing protein n=1 Tax=Paramarasmius palmivorus TaxID=297713 RepID=A0AAW0CXF0_9AGAR
MASSNIRVTLPHLRASKPPLPIAELQEKLRSPDSFPQKNHGEISAYIQDAEHDVRLYEAYVQQLRAKQAALQRDIACYTSLQSPIRHLPTEILREVFRFAKGSIVLGCKDRQSPAFVLSAVCSRWREVALGFPELWSDIVIMLDKKYEDEVKLCIERSREHPLTLGAFGPQSVPVFECLREQRHRWRQVEVPQSLIELSSSSSTGGIPMLKSLLYSASRLNTVPSDMLDWAAIVPNLQELSSIGGAPTSIDNFPWRKIRCHTMQHGGPVSLRSAIRALRLSSNLVYFKYQGLASALQPDITIQSSYTERLPDSDLQPLVTSKIESLHFHVWDDRGTYALLGDFLRAVRLPSLTALSIHSACSGIKDQEHNRATAFEGEWPRNIVDAFMARSRCQLRTLELCGMPLTDSDVLAILHLTPNLEEFTVHEVFASTWDPTPKSPISKVAAVPHDLLVETVTTHLLEQLQNPELDASAFRAQRHALVPKLKRLRMRTQQHFRADGAFVQLVLSRWYCGVGSKVERLKEVELTVVHSQVLEPEVYEPLKALERGWLMVTVIDSSGYVV